LFPVLRLFFLSPEKAADTIIYLASSPEVANTTGAFFVKRKVTEPSAAARDDPAAKRPTAAPTLPTQHGSAY
jgi:hypothetical protein